MFKNFYLLGWRFTVQVEKHPYGNIKRFRRWTHPWPDREFNLMTVRHGVYVHLRLAYLNNIWRRMKCDNVSNVKSGHR